MDTTLGSLEEGQDTNVLKSIQDESHKIREKGRVKARVDEILEIMH